MPRKPEDDFAVSFGSQVLRGVERFIQRDAETALDQYRQLLLAAHDFEQLEILRVARTDLQHDAGGVARHGKAPRRSLPHGIHE